LSSWNRVSAEYFEAIGTPILKGRGITAQDTATSRKVVVVSETFARRFFGDEDPIGKRFGPSLQASREYEIIGVARDARYFTHDLDQPSGPLFFLPEAQADYAKINLGSLFLRDIVIVTTPGADVPIASIRQAMASVNPDLPITTIRSLREQVSNRFTQQRLIARLTSFFGVLSLLLASIGLYGVTAYNAGRRTNEIGVRLALGASRGHVVRLVLRNASALILFGLLLGLPLTLAVGRLLGNQLYGTSPYNPAVIGVAIVVLACSALLASIIPACRASMISPLDALRTE
jgi:predicted permease